MNIVLGITGGIAAYKACDVIVGLKAKGHNVDVIMTESATKFITPLTVGTLSKNKVITDMFEEVLNYDVKHISLAEKADVFVIVPATANIIGKIAGGIADDILTTTIMASKSKKIIVPAMNVNMWENEIVQDNISWLKDKGYLFIDPIEGNLACNVYAKGKMEKPRNIVEFIEKEIKKL